jgi:hypothetical protein
MTSRARALVARVPDERDRFADLLRVGAIVMVVLGHWMVAVVLTNDELRAQQLLAVEPWTRPLTWVFQVMPVFFYVGGYVNVASYRRSLSRGESWTRWVRRRAMRLLGPLVPVLGLWLPTAVVFAVLGLSEDLIERAVETALLPVWFLVVYLIAIGLVPLSVWLHERFGAWVLAVTSLLLIVVDRLEMAGVPVVGYLNYGLVWLSVHQLGYFWADGRLPTRPWTRAALGAAAGAVTVALVRFADYPVSMVAVWGEQHSNTDPPSVTLWTFALAQIGLLMAMQGPLRRLLQRPAVYAPIVLLGSVVLTIFLWHMTALVLTTTLAYPTGLLPAATEIDATWWLYRPLWLLLCSLVLAGLVALFRRFEQVTPPVPRAHRWRTILSLLATVVGLALLMIGGVYDPDRTAGVPLAVLGVLAVGLGGLGVLRQPKQVVRDASDER